MFPCATSAAPVAPQAIPRLRPRDFVVSTIRASIMTCGVAVSRFSINWSTPDRYVGISRMISVLVRVSTTMSPRRDITLLIVGVSSLAFAYDSFLITVRVGSAACRASDRRARSDCSACSLVVVAMRMMLFSSTYPRPFCFRIRSSAWSHGTSSSWTVTVPRTSGSTTMFNWVSWEMVRKTSLMSASFRSREIGSPVNCDCDSAMVRG